MTGQIELSRSKFFYRGFTPSILRVVEATFQERNTILRMLGLREMYSFEQLKENIADPEVQQLEGPSDINHRFVTEDCPMGLVALTSLGDLVGVSTPICKALVTLISEIIGINCFKEGRNLESLGISGLSADELNRFLDEGHL